MTDTLIPPERLERWVTALLETHGTPQADAGVVAHSLVDADRCGHRSHGVRQLPYYVELIESGELIPAAEVLVTEERGGLVRLDGQRGFGHLTGERATDIALTGADRHGVAAVCGREAGHLGRLGAYTERIAGRRHGGDPVGEQPGRRPADSAIRFC